MAKKIDIVAALEQNPEFVQKMCDHPIPIALVKDFLFKYAVEQTFKDIPTNTILWFWDNLQTRQMFCDYGYTGEYRRAARILGYDLRLTNPDGSLRNKNAKNTLWQLIRITSGIQEVEKFPQIARDAWKSSAKCNLSGIPLDGNFELDHRRPRHYYGNVNLTPLSTVEECRNVTQPLSSRANTKKREVCNKCQKTKVRPNGGYNEIQEYWYEGDKNLDPEIGCNGCFWAFPEKYNAELNRIIKIKQI